jgi:Ca2+-binding EF-hand superfamily protein
MFFGKKTLIPKIKRTNSMQVNLKRIKKLLMEYMVKHSLNVDEIFAVINKRNAKEIGPEDFVSAFKQKIPDLSDEDIRDLFRAIDIDKSGSIELDEVKLELANVNAALVLKDLKNCGKTVEELFKVAKFGKDDDKLTIVELAELINLGVKTTPKTEVDIIFRAVDKKHNGYLTKADLKSAMEQVDSVLQASVVVSPNDLWMPLLTKIRKRLSLGADAIFTKFKDSVTQKVGPG